MLYQSWIRPHSAPSSQITVKLLTHTDCDFYPFTLHVVTRLVLFQSYTLPILLSSNLTHTGVQVSRDNFPWASLGLALYSIQYRAVCSNLCTSCSMQYLNILICVEYLSRKSCIWCSKGPPHLRTDGSRAPRWCWAGAGAGCIDPWMWRCNETKTIGVSAC